MNITDQAVRTNALTYKAYVALFETLLNEGKSTSDDPHYNEKEIIELTKLNLHRLKRIEKTSKLREDLQKAILHYPRNETWICFTESWCGDAATNLPLLALMAEQSQGKFELKCLLRDNHPELMDQFLTNGGKAIPKLVRIDNATNTVVGTWGPRPQVLTELVAEWKATGMDVETLKYNVYGWYPKNKGQALQDDWLKLLS